MKSLIKCPFTPNNSLNPLLNYVGTKIRIEFNGSCLKQDKISFNHGKVVNIYIFYEINKNYNISSFLSLENCLFGAVELAKHPDIDQYKYSGCSIGFDRKGLFSFGNEIGRNIIVFGVFMSSSPHIDNKKKNRVWKKLEHALATEKLFSINFTKINTTFYLSLHYNGANKHLFANGTEIIKFKAKDSEIVAYTLCLGKISKDIFVDNMKKIGLNRYIYNFSIDYNAIPVDDILDIYKYLMKKHDVK